MEDYVEQLKAIKHSGIEELKAIEYADKGQKLRRKYNEVKKGEILDLQRKAK